MNSKSGYQTHQRQMLLDFLIAHSDRSFSVDEISQQLSCFENPPGKSTVYRLINKMVEEDIVHRLTGDNKKTFVYQYTGKINCTKHLHLKCLSCGRLIHIEDDLTQSGLGSIMQKYNFNIDNSKSVLYGSCDKCSSIKNHQL